MALRQRQQNQFNRLQGLQDMGQQLNQRQQNRFGFLQKKQQQSGGGGEQLTPDVPGAQQYKQFRNRYGGMDFGSVPGTLAGQSASDVEYAQGQQRLNRINEFNPYGSATYSTDAQGNTIRNYSLSPEEQSKLNQERQIEGGANELAKSLMGGAASIYNNPLSFSDLGAVPQADAAERKRIEDIVYNRFQDRMNPQFQRDEEAFRQRMANEGAPEGSEKYQKAYRELKQGQNDALLDASARATQFGGEEMANLQNLALQNRQQGIGERLTQRGLPLQEIGGLLGLGSGVFNPNFAPMSQIDVPRLDVGGLASTYRGQDVQRYGINKGGGKTDPFALLAAETAAKLQLADQQHQYDLALQKQGQPSFGQGLAGLGSGVLQGLTGGFFNKVGGGLYDKFPSF